MRIEEANVLLKGLAAHVGGEADRDTVSSFLSLVLLYSPLLLRRGTSSPSLHLHSSLVLDRGVSQDPLHLPSTRVSGASASDLPNMDVSSPCHPCPASSGRLYWESWVAQPDVVAVPERWEALESGCHSTMISILLRSSVNCIRVLGVRQSCCGGSRCPWLGSLLPSGLVALF